MCLSLGAWVDVGLVASFAAEVLILIGIATGALSNPFMAKEYVPIQREARDYSNWAVNLAGLTLATIGIVYSASTVRLGANLTTISDVLMVLMLSLIFFLGSYSVERLVGHSRFYWVLQDKALAFGLFSMVTGLLVLAIHEIPTAVPLVGSGLAVLVLIHIREAIGDAQHWKFKEQDQRAGGPVAP